MSTSKNIALTSSDGQKVCLDDKSAERSNLLKGLIQDYTEDTDIPMPDIRGDVLKRVVEYLVHYKEAAPREIPKPLPSANLLDVTDEWDVSFINGVDLDTTFDIINAANYMDIKPLLDLSCAKIASLMKGKTAEEIRTMFNIECDLTEEELKEYEEYQI
jgi:S-phase kinase-associated protein 1